MSRRVLLSLLMLAILGCLIQDVMGGGRGGHSDESDESNEYNRRKPAYSMKRPYRKDYPMKEKAYPTQQYDSYHQPAKPVAYNKPSYRRDYPRRKSYDQSREDSYEYRRRPTYYRRRRPSIQKIYRPITFGPVMKI